MTWRTHVLGGLAALWALGAIPRAVTADTLLPLTAAAALGALLPDLDADRSKIRSLGAWGIRPFAPVAVAVNRALGHRGLLHSWVGLAAAGLLALSLSPWSGWATSAALCLGYASHLALDACTPFGLPRVPLRNGERRNSASPGPGDRRRLHLLPPRLRVVTGSTEEDVVLALLCGAVLWLFLTHFPFR